MFALYHFSEFIYGDQLIKCPWADDVISLVNELKTAIEDITKESIRKPHGGRIAGGERATDGGRGYF